MYIKKPIKNRVIAVTANHVVRSDNPDIKTKKILIRFHQYSGKSYKAELLGLSYPELDLALLEIPKPSEGYKWEKKYFHPILKETTRYGLSDETKTGMSPQMPQSAASTNRLSWAKFMWIYTASAPEHQERL